MMMMMMTTMKDHILNKKNMFIFESQLKRLIDVLYIILIKETKKKKLKLKTSLLLLLRNHKNIYIRVVDSFLELLKKSDFE